MYKLFIDRIFCLALFGIEKMLVEKSDYHCVIVKKILGIKKSLVYMRVSSFFIEIKFNKNSVQKALFTSFNNNVTHQIFTSKNVDSYTQFPLL